LTFFLQFQNGVKTAYGTTLARPLDLSEQGNRGIELRAADALSIRSSGRATGIAVWTLEGRNFYAATTLLSSPLADDHLT